MWFYTHHKVKTQITQVCFSAFSMDIDCHNTAFVYVYGYVYVYDPMLENQLTGSPQQHIKISKKMI